MAQSWDRGQGESAKAYQAFAVYRDLGPDRSTAKVGQDLGKSKVLMDRWSSRHKWVERARDYDFDVDEQRRHRIASDREMMQEIHVALAKQILDKVVAGVSAIDAKRLTARDIARLADVGTKIQIRALGEPRTNNSAIIEVNVMIDEDGAPR